MVPSGGTALVTGASRGIGRAIAIAFAHQGYTVWALARSGDALKGLGQESKRDRGSVRPIEADVSSADDIVRACAAILAEGGPPSVLINNAGVAVSAPLAKTTDEDFRRLIAINLTAPFLFCRELMPAMAEAGGGRVINIASTAALKGFKYTTAYCASKHALLGLTRALGVEFAGRAVTVNAVCPGWSDTQMTTDSASRIARATGRSPSESRQLLAQMNPIGRLIRPDEVAAVCLFLASPAAASITGAAYVIDGGETI